MLKIGGVTFLMGLVILGNGAIFMWRGQTMQHARVSDPSWAKTAKQFRDAGIVVAAAGLVIVLGSLLIIAERGF